MVRVPSPLRGGSGWGSQSQNTTPHPVSNDGATEITSPRWGEVERSEGEGAPPDPESAVTPHPPRYRATTSPSRRGEERQLRKLSPSQTNPHPNPPRQGEGNIASL